LIFFKPAASLSIDMYNDAFLQARLDQRIADNALRRLVYYKGLTDFCSNDYLGIATHSLCRQANDLPARHGSGGARTLAGNYPLIEATEEKIASFHEAEAALIFNSGYTANLGIMSAIPQRGDQIFYDYLSHASLRDGIRLSHAEAFSFAHNDVNDLEKKLSRAREGRGAQGQLFVVTESLFSMDGDLAPLEDLLLCCEKYDAHLVVDEAHATGVMGPAGAGVLQSQGLHKRVFARIYTFGKALGCHGAAVFGSSRLKSYLINFSRSFIFTTALPEAAIRSIDAAYDLFPTMDQERQQLQSLIERFRSVDLPFSKLNSVSPIQAVIIPGNDKVKTVAAQLQQQQLDVRPILYPTVPKGKERLRISLHAFNTTQELDRLIQCLATMEV
jgi:8-amino-7-oxononanoate synthase